MTKHELLDKKAYYELLKADLQTKDFSKEIEEELQEYREKLMKKYDSCKQEDLKKVDHYLELLSELLEFERTQEVKAAIIEDKMTVQNETAEI